MISNRYMSSDNEELCFEEMPCSTNSIHRSMFLPDANVPPMQRYKLSLNLNNQNHTFASYYKRVTVV